MRLYGDMNRDPFADSYGPVYATYDTAAVTPKVLRNHIYWYGNACMIMTHLLLVYPAGESGDDPVLIFPYHGFTWHDVWIGQMPTDHDGIRIVFLGDIVNGQAPMTVTILDNTFSSDGVVQVPKTAPLEQLHLANPSVKLVGLFEAGDADTDPLT